MKNKKYKILNSMIYWVIQVRWIILAFLGGAIFLLLPAPDGLSLEGWRIIAIIVTSLILIITEPIPLPAIAFIMIVLQVYLGIGDPNQVAKAFMNDAVFFIMGSLMLAVAIIQQGWDTRIALGIIKITGNKTYRIAGGFALISAIMSSFIGGHTVAAIMLPIGMTLVKFTSRDAQKVTGLAALLLFSIAYGSLIGSIGTPSGGGRNAIMLIYWQEYGADTLSYGTWMKYVYPLVLIQIPILSWVLWKSFPAEYSQLDSGIRRLKVQVAKSGKIGHKQWTALFIFCLIFLGWVFLSEKYGLGIIALTGVILYIVTGLVKWEDISRYVNWGVIILFGATISLGTQIKETGAAEWIANFVFGFMNDSAGYYTDIMIVGLTTAMANIISSSATVAVLGPVTLNMPGDTVHTGLLTAIASAFGYFTAVAAPACTIVYSSGMVKAKDFLKAGWKMGFISIVLLIIYANTYWAWLS